MLSRTELSPIQHVISIQALDRAADLRQEAFSRLMQIVIGQTLQGTIQSALDNGTYLVRLADTTARMALPSGMKAGDMLQLTLIDKAARPTFLLQQTGDSTSPTLSNTARLIDRVLQASAAAGNTALQGDKPLLSLPAPTAANSGVAVDVPALAASLQNALVKSGVFYESHLAQWASGRLPLSELQQEPQARHGAFFHSDAPSNGTPVDARHAQVATVLGAQFDALEHQHLAWHGQAWQDQKIEWEMERRDHPAAPAQDHADRVWQTSVGVGLPLLGTVTATMRLINGRLQMQVHVEEMQTHAMLTEHAYWLADAFAAAGLPLEALSVTKDDDAA